MDEDSLERKRTLESELSETPFLLATNGLGDCFFRIPGDIYFLSPQLEMYFDENPNGWLLVAKYDDYVEQLEELDVKYQIRVSLKEQERDGHVSLPRPWNRRGSKWNPYVRGYNGFDPECSAEGLAFALKHPNPEKAAYIWNGILLPNKSRIAGVVEKSTRWDFTGIFESKTTMSRMGKLVCESAWLPDQYGSFVKPSELSLDDLPDDFRKDNDLANSLGMRTANVSIQDLLGRDDISDSDKRKLEFMKELDDEDCKFVEENIGLIREMREMKEQDVEQQIPGDYPPDLEDRFNRSGSSSGTGARVDGDFPESNPEDRHIDTEMDIGNPLDADERSEIRASRKWKVKNPKTRRFLYGQYMGHCQICDETFRKRDDDNYFEAVHFLRRTKGSWLDHPRNAICLCANHSKQFQFGELMTSNQSILDQIRMSEEGRGHDIFVELCWVPQTISFSADHIFELKAALEITESL